jgi:hypothetical protein
VPAVTGNVIMNLHNRTAEEIILLNILSSKVHTNLLMPDKMPYLNFYLVDYLADNAVITDKNFKRNVKLLKKPGLDI